MQLIRMPLGAYWIAARIVQMMITCFERRYPSPTRSGVASHQAFASSYPGVSSRPATASIMCSQPMPPAEEIVATALPDGIISATFDVRCLAATKFTSIVSSPENGGPGSPAQLKSAFTVPPRSATALSIASGERRSTFV